MTLLETIAMPPLSAENIERITSRYLSDYIPEHLLQPERLNPEELFSAIFQSHNTQIQLVDKFFDCNVEAQINFGTNKLEVTEFFLEKLDKEDGRSLFTIGHESSHLIFHTSFAQTMLQTAARAVKPTANKEIPIYQKSEWQAEHGGGAILMPLDTLQPLLRDCELRRCSPEVIVEIISESYGVTMSAANSRYKAVMKSNLASYRRTLGFKI